MEDGGRQAFLFPILRGIFVTERVEQARVGEPLLVVFDLSGTTVMDAGQVPAAFSAALKEHGLEASADQIHRVRGASKREAIRQFVPDTPERSVVAGRIYDTFSLRLMHSFRSGGIREVEGAEHLFAWLRLRGICVALNTGFDREITTTLLASLKWDRGLMDAVVCGDDVRRGRPAPDLIHRAMQSTGVANSKLVANVGDTVLDLEAGYNAGVGWNIGVLTGAHDATDLQQAPHTHILDSILQLRTLFSTPSAPPGSPA